MTTNNLKVIRELCEVVDANERRDYCADMYQELIDGEIAYETVIETLDRIFTEYLERDEWEEAQQYLDKLKTVESV